MRPLPYFIQSSLLRAVPGVYHAFTGVDPVDERKMKEQLAEAFAVSSETIGTLKQIHSNVVRRLEPGDTGAPDAGSREGDALWTETSGMGVGVRTADCVPVLIAHRRFPLVAAVHAGWRGLASGIIWEAIRALEDRIGKEAVSGLVAAVGPCARACCYEVGEETADALASISAVLLKGEKPGKWFADLQATALSALAAAGIPASCLEGVGPCTICSPLFYSFRHEKSVFRQLSFIRILRSGSRFSDK
ncbi:MAG: polyphenol oxidase family protein [Syntrophorhabdaceae bacterium]|nr:polyphenol oxidase family protein [Syntrophorhabdaceae bacterium]